MKDSLFIDICRNDYRAVFQMVRRAIELCPDSLWNERTDEPPFWQQAYHTIFYIDFYLSDSPGSSRVVAPVEDEAANLKHIPASAPSRQQIQDYLEEAIKQCDLTLEKLASAPLDGENKFPWTGPTLAHRLIYNIRHAQHHVGRLNSILSRKTGKAAEWVITAKS
jgi:hypothetical protein